MANFKEILGLAGRQAAIGFGRVGARAMAAAYSQVAKDVDAFAAEAHRRTSTLKQKLDDFFAEQVGPNGRR